MKKLSQFCREHPTMIACFTTAIMAAAITELFFVDLINKTQGWESGNITIAFRIVVLLAIPTLWWAVIRATKPITLLLVASLVFGVPKANAAPLVIGGLLIVVIGGGAIVGCKIVNKCKKIAKKREHQLTNEQFMVAGESYDAALLTWPDGGYCAAERLLPVEPTVFTFGPTFPRFPGDEMTIFTKADRGYEFTQTWSEFEQEVSSYDLFLSHPVSYSKNGHRCEPEQSIISFSTNRIAKIGRGGLLVTIERSSDLKTWEPVLKLNIEPWMTPRIEDCSDEDQQTYRITVSEP